MAIGDVITQLIYEGGYTYMTPSSGDEWMITAMGHYSVTTSLQITPDNGSTWWPLNNSYTGTNTIASKVLMSDNTPLRWFVTSTFRIRAHRYSGTKTWWWMGIKSKE